MTPAQAKHFEESVDALYQSVTDERQWPVALQAMSRFMEAPGISVLRTSACGTHLLDVQAVHRDPETETRYRDLYWRFDPAYTASRQAAVGEWIDCSDLLDPATTAHPEYVRDYARKHGIRWVAGAKVHDDQEVCVVVGLQRGADSPPFADGCRERLAALAPHVKRASLLAAELRGLRNQRSVALAALDELAHAAFVVDASGRVLQANRAAETLLRSGPAAPLCSQGGQLELTQAAQQPRLAAALAQACGKGARKASAFQERAGSKGARWVIRVVPLRGLGAAALVYAAELPALPPPAQLLQEVLGLTPGEAGVAHLLADGYNVKEVAQARGVTEFTVRTQIRALLAKAGARRQSELAQALFAIPGVRSDGVGR